MEPMMTPTQVAEWLDVSTNTLSQWRYMRSGPAFYKVGRHVRYKQSEVSAWLDAQAGEARGAA